MEYKITITSIGLLVLLLAVVLPRVDIEVSPTSVEAQAGLPSEITKFNDGDVDCYVLDKFKPIGSANYAYGISCVK